MNGRMNEVAIAVVSVCLAGILFLVSEHIFRRIQARSLALMDEHWQHDAWEPLPNGKVCMHEICRNRRLDDRESGARVRGPLSDYMPNHTYDGQPLTSSDAETQRHNAERHGDLDTSTSDITHD